MRKPSLVPRLLLCLLLASSLSAQQQRPTQADSVVRLLTDLENAIGSTNTDELARLTGSSMAAAELTELSGSLFRLGQTFAAVRERDRRPAGAGFALLVE